MKYCSHLARGDNAAVPVTDIGVITPYRKQVELKSNNFRVAIFYLADLHCGCGLLKQEGISQNFAVVHHPTQCIINH